MIHVDINHQSCHSDSLCSSGSAGWVMKKVLLTMLTTNSTTPTTSVIEKKDDLSVYGHTYLSP